MNGGRLIAEILLKHDVEHLFTLCGGHISPILTEANRLGVRIVDVRHEATAVFAADAVSRLTRRPGVAAVTAGPGLTNAVTALKNAHMAQSPLVLLGGATATFLKGRGALQDIDQLSLARSAVKWTARISRLRELGPVLQRAFQESQQGVPGPVFVELPVDLLYEESIVKNWYADVTGGDSKPKSATQAALRAYLKIHANRIFAGAQDIAPSEPLPIEYAHPNDGHVQKAVDLIMKSKRPLMIVGSQALQCPCTLQAMADSVGNLGIPVYLNGMARGLLGKTHILQLKHRRKAALKQADLVILAGVPADFRLNYGMELGGRTTLISVNRSPADLTMNIRPKLAINADPGLFINELAQRVEVNRVDWSPWVQSLKEREDRRNAEIIEQSGLPAGPINPIFLARGIEDAMDDDRLIVVDGGDFVATASYVLRPNGPLTWLDPGVFGTLGVGAGFALGAKLIRPESEVWLLYGDGSLGYSLAEFDTFARHGIPIIAVVGNDAGWTQIARDQVAILKNDVGTVLNRTAYHEAAQGLGAKGILLDKPEQIPRVLKQAKEAARAGHPVLINAHIGKTEFRKGSISI